MLRSIIFIIIREIFNISLFSYYIIQLNIVNISAIHSTIFDAHAVDDAVT